ncbi:MAG: proprotein convertase P-domain-containing protein [Microscillaceae bacterium]|jgi:subtilisin-like proprotein convertase family protein|nr:proprotein convertase P-domain-containing protein [Microscillaceae bacterium]
MNANFTLKNTAPILMFILLGIASCKKNEEEPSIPLTFTPTKGYIGDVITLNGGFDADKTKNLVKFGDKTAVVNTATTTQLTVVVPNGAVTGKISVTVNGRTATSVNEFEVDQRLKLPAVLENNIALNVPDATKISADCGTGVTPGIAENTIVIEREGIVADGSKISIELDISHGFGGDVVAELILPSGASVGLIKRIGAVLDNGCGVKNAFIVGNKLTFNSTFTNTTISDPIATGNYAPLKGTSNYPSNITIAPLNTFFQGQNIKGTWKMKMYDYGFPDAGKLNAWKIKFEVGALQ